MKFAFLLIQVLFLIAAAPLLSGLIRKWKNTLRMRKGPGLLQPYYHLRKLLIKEEVVSGRASWIFRVTPLIVFGATATAAFLVPVFTSKLSLSSMGDFFLIIFILALGRFFLALAGLDAGSAFGGMGSSREMFISSLVEPVALLSIMAVSMNAGSTGLERISGVGALRFSSVIAAMGLFIVTIAETARIPVDNQETHLELTMVHEAMVLEYSGPSLALIEMASHLKQILFFSLLANVMLPWGMPASFEPVSILGGIGVYAGKMVCLGLMVGIVEISMAKMRLFRVFDFLSFAFVLSMTALATSAIGL
jgi:formate hydrogenlyase subunit 4